MAGPVRFIFKDARTGKKVTILHCEMLTSAPHTADGGQTTWITCVNNQRFHVNADPNEVAALISAADPEAGIDEVVA